MSLLQKKKKYLTMFGDKKLKTFQFRINVFWRTQPTSEQKPKYKMAKISTICFLLYNHRLQRKYRVAAEILGDFNEKMCK